MMSTYNNQLSKQAVWNKVYLWLNTFTVLWFVRAISFANETPHWLHLKANEVCRKEYEGKGGHSEEVGNVHSKGGRTFHAGLRGKLYIYIGRNAQNLKKVCNVESNGGRTFHARLRGKLLIICSSWQSMLIAKHKREYLENWKRICQATRNIVFLLPMVDAHGQREGEGRQMKREEGWEEEEELTTRAAFCLLHLPRVLLAPPAKGTLAPITLGSATYMLASSQFLFKPLETGGIYPTHFELYPTTIQPGGVV